MPALLAGKTSGHVWASPTTQAQVTLQGRFQQTACIRLRSPFLLLLSLAQAKSDGRAKKPPAADEGTEKLVKKRRAADKGTGKPSKVLVGGRDGGGVGPKKANAYNICKDVLIQVRAIAEPAGVVEEVWSTCGFS